MGKVFLGLIDHYRFSGDCESLTGAQARQEGACRQRRMGEKEASEIEGVLVGRHQQLYLMTLSKTFWERAS